ncbi:methyltransferase domain-containing protein [Burkholderia sp. FERM BP-3421]|jgi:ubiquinone/menaquinone biosynthesis C-methylase UbiE|uniref:class I SAM-dependent methyltransferase n=1 Tax=Burkholderia sp. FERM BP-3421 TaxID=1494466 RepID=UPI00235E30C1|nr:class I SAM-dependent methyltransferase [Burkholderia sp. FERM BP-3421]WDD91787.1 methyltransferase domain-containing protein [Burkholderia sp. FERM BP-3421]
MNPNASQHNQTIISQFSRQAVPFAALPGHSTSIRTLIDLCELNGTETVLDVACGPGLVANAFAEHAAHVTGLDLTPDMIEEARRRQPATLDNLDWRVGDIRALPFADASFSVVLTRYTFHHFLDPQAALREMMRVCRPGGRILIADIVQQPDKAAAYDHLELLRDPSHVHALTFAEMDALIAGSGLADIRTARYKIDTPLDPHLAASFPNPGDEAKIRDLFAAELEEDHLGLDVRRTGDGIVFSFPILVVTGIKPA